MKLVDNDNVIGNWPDESTMKTIPIRTSKAGDLLADEYRAILLAILEETEGKQLYVGKRPEGMCPAYVPAFHALIHVLAQDADWLIKRVDGECVMRSEYQPDNDVQPDFTASLQPPLVPMTPPVCTPPRFTPGASNVFSPACCQHEETSTEEACSSQPEAGTFVHDAQSKFAACSCTLGPAAHQGPLRSGRRCRRYLHL
jgi:hypothetical protein